jgi:hypothetical protein
LNRSLRDPDADLQELAPNALGSPEAVLGRHAPDKRDNIRSETRLARTARAGFSTPEEPERFTLPSKHRLRLDEEQRMDPTGNQPSEQDEQTTLVTAKARSLDAAGSDDELLAQKCVLDEQLTARTG